MNDPNWGCPPFARPCGGVTFLQRKQKTKEGYELQLLHYSKSLDYWSAPWRWSKAMKLM